MNKTYIKRLARSAILASAAIAASALEGLLPYLPFMPPGAKIGTSNIVSMYAAKTVGVAEALAISVIKSLFVLLTRGFTAFLLSFFGGIISTAVTSVMLRRGETRFGYVGIGVVGALCHNASQLAVFALISGTSILWYAPFLLIASVISGSVTGIVLFALIKANKNNIS